MKDQESHKVEITTQNPFVSKTRSYMILNESFQYFNGLEGLTHRLEEKSDSLVDLGATLGCQGLRGENCPAKTLFVLADFFGWKPEICVWEDHLIQLHLALGVGFQFQTFLFFFFRKNLQPSFRRRFSFQPICFGGLGGSNHQVNHMIILVVAEGCGRFQAMSVWIA